MIETHKAILPDILGWWAWDIPVAIDDTKALEKVSPGWLRISDSRTAGTLQISRCRVAAPTCFGWRLCGYAKRASSR